MSEKRYITHYSSGRLFTITDDTKNHTAHVDLAEVQAFDCSFLATGTSTVTIAIHGFTIRMSYSTRAAAQQVMEELLQRKSSLIFTGAQ